MNNSEKKTGVWLDPKIHFRCEEGDRVRALFYFPEKELFYVLDAHAPETIDDAFVVKHKFNDAFMMYLEVPTEFHNV